MSSSKNKFSVYFYNRVTYLVVVLALVVFIIECFLFGIDLFSKETNVYLGIITYCLLPPFLILGLLLIPIGAVWKKRRIDKGVAEQKPKTLYIDLTIPAHRNAVIVFLVGTSIFIVMTAIGSYKAFNYTESVHF